MRFLSWRFSFCSFLIVTPVEVVGTVGNSERFWRRVFHSFQNLDLLRARLAEALFLLNLERETDCYSWPDSVGRHTLVDAARSIKSLGHSRRPGSSVSNTNLPALAETNLQLGCSFC